MNKYEMKQKAYQSTLKSRALQVLTYLIDRSNKEGTCFPAIATISRELHISVSTVKRSLRELTESGFVKKESRFREKNNGQTSNLYILCTIENVERVEAKEDKKRADFMGGNYEKNIYNQMTEVIEKLNVMEFEHKRERAEVNSFTSAEKSLCKENFSLREEVSGLKQKNVVLVEENSSLKAENRFLLRTSSEKYLIRLMEEKLRKRSREPSRAIKRAICQIPMWSGKNRKGIYGRRIEQTWNSNRADITNNSVIHDNDTIFYHFGNRHGEGNRNRKTERPQ